MSLSTPRLQNPCKKFIEFKGDIGVFRYWDKATEKNIELKYPITFVVLDELSTITGYNDHTKSGVYSNEVRSIKNQTLNVRTFKGNLRSVGKYADIKSEIAGMGGKYTKSVYAALITNDSMGASIIELTNFQLKGISFKAWLGKKVDISTQGVKVESCSDGKKGKVTYKIPNYEAASISKELMEHAIEMDKKLQEYLKEYELKNKSSSHSDDGVQESPEEIIGENQHEETDGETEPF